MKTALISILAIAVLGAAVWYALGGSEDKAAAKFGQGVAGAVTLIGDVQRDPDAYVGKTVTVEGRLTKECPSTGCWWYLKDSSGEIRADSLGAGFALPMRQEGKLVRTTGKVTRTEGGELQISATGAELR